MHELSIALSIVDLVQEEADRRGGVQVMEVHVKIGALSGVVPDALLASYEMACQGTPLDGSRLIVDEVPVLMKCPACQAERPVSSLQFLCCVACGTPASEIVQGRELLVTGMEVLE